MQDYKVNYLWLLFRVALPLNGHAGLHSQCPVTFPWAFTGKAHGNGNALSESLHRGFSPHNFTPMPGVHKPFKALLTGDPCCLVISAGYAEKEKVMHATLGNVLEQLGEGKLPFEYLLYVGDFLAQK